MSDLPLIDKCILVAGAARRVGKIFALARARAGADVVIHHGHSDAEAEKVHDEITGLGRQAWIFKANLDDSEQTRELISLRPGADHFPYMISKASLPAMTRSLAVALAPKIRVNGLAAILSPLMERLIPIS